MARGDWPTAVVLEFWEDSPDGFTYSIDISDEVDVPIQQWRALGEYFIAAADRYAPEGSTGTSSRQ